MNTLGAGWGEAGQPRDCPPGGSGEALWLQDAVRKHGDGGIFPVLVILGAGPGCRQSIGPLGPMALQGGSLTGPLAFGLAVTLGP